MTSKYKLILLTMFAIFVGSDLVDADLELNQAPLLAQLAGDHGGRLDSASWNSSELEGDNPHVDRRWP